MKKVGVIFGGRSVEHEVSVITGMQIIENIDKTWKMDDRKQLIGF